MSRVSLAWAGFAALAVGALGLTALEYVIPPDAKSGWWLCNQAADQFRQHVPGAAALPRLSAAGFYWGFRAALVLTWAGYVGLLVAVRQPGVVPRGLRTAAIGLGVIVGALSPPVLSSDVYCYAMYGHRAVVYGRNPYGVTPDDPHPRGDPGLRYAQNDVAPPYGPVWVGVCVTISALLQPLGLWAEVVGLKVFQAVALAGAAYAASGVTARLAPGFGDLAFLAVAVHPVLLIEGPGSGHNDTMMAALVVAGVWAWAAERPLLGAALVGLAAGVKWLPIAALPWLLIAAYRRWGGKRTVGVLAAFVLPPAVAFVPFAPGAQLGVSAAWHMKLFTPPAERERDQERREQLEQAGLPPAAAAVGTVLRKNWLLAVLYAGLTGFVLRSRWPTAWVEAWVLLTPALLLGPAGRMFPWYLAWGLVPGLTGACRFARVVGLVGAVLGILLTWRYTIVW
jgi:alpha-1,6-mannosyltransferase